MDSDKLSTAFSMTLMNTCTTNDLVIVVLMVGPIGQGKLVNQVPHRFLLLAD